MSAVGRASERLFVGAVALMGLVSAAVAIFVDVGGRRVVALADAIAWGKVLDPDSAGRFVDRPPDWKISEYCRQDQMLAVGRVAAGALDTIIRRGDIDRVEPAIVQLKRGARLALACGPAESLAWAWLAMAENQANPDDETVLRLFERSQWTAPSDLWVIAIRLPEIARAYSRRGGRFGELARADIRTLFQDEHVISDTSVILGSTFQWIGVIAQEEFRRVTDPVVRERYKQAFGFQRANIAACDGDKFVDWLYRGQRGDCEKGARIPVFDWRGNSR